MNGKHTTIKTDGIAEQPCQTKQVSTTKGNGVGVIKELAELLPDTILDEKMLADIFHRHPVSIKRAVKRGELPPPVKSFGKPCWTAGVILNHFAKRLEAAQRKAEKDAAKFARLAT